MLTVLLAAVLGFYLGSAALVFLSIYHSQMDLVRKLEVPFPKSYAGRYALGFVWRGPYFLYRESYRSVGLALMQMVGILEMTPGLPKPEPATTDAPPVPDEIAQLVMRMAHTNTDRPVS